MPFRRAPGVKNVLTRNLKTLGMNGIANAGSDGKGKGGAQGWFNMCARKYPKDYLQFLTKFIPHEIKADVSGTSTIKTINIIGVPSGTFFTHEQATAILNGNAALPLLEAAIADREAVEPEPIDPGSDASDPPPDDNVLVIPRRYERPG